MQKRNYLFLIIILVIVVMLGFLFQYYYSENKIKTEKNMEYMEVDGEFLSIQMVNWEDPEHPMQSTPINEKDIPEQSIKINVSSGGFSPDTFEVEKNSKIILNLNNTDEKWVHMLVFEDKDLSDVFIEVGPNQKRLITFYAPSEKGEYGFYCRVPGHKSDGEIGTMIVK